MSYAPIFSLLGTICFMFAFFANLDKRDVDEKRVVREAEQFASVFYGADKKILFFVYTPFEKLPNGDWKCRVTSEDYVWEQNTPESVLLMYSKIESPYSK